MEENKTNNEPKELDLIDIIKLCIKAVKKCIDMFKRAIISILRINIKYWYILLTFIVAGACIAFLTRPQEQKCASFHLKTFFVPAQSVINNINYLNNKIDGKGNAKLANMLCVPQKDVKNITNIYACAVYDINGDEIPDKDIANINDTSKVPMKYALHVFINSEGNCDFEVIKNALISYNNKDKSITEVSKYNYETQMYELNGYESEIRKIDSARAQIASSGKFSIDKSGESMQFAGDPFSIKEMQDLIETCARIRFAMTQQRIPVATLSPTYVNTIASSIKRTATIIILFYLAGLILGYAIKNRKAIINALKED